MASNTKQAVKDALLLREELTTNYIELWKSLFHNSIELLNGGDLPKRYLFETLLNRGAIAYDRETKLYLPFVAAGVDVYGLPTTYTLLGANGFTRTRKPAEVVILRANDVQYPLIALLRSQAKKLVELDMTFLQNLEAVKTCVFMECPNESVALTIANAYEARKTGAVVVFTNKMAGINKLISSFRTDVPYLGAELLEARKEILNETLSSIGISVANTDKRERVQSLEVTASQGFAKDMLSTLVETFNYDAEYGGIDVKLVANTTLATEDNPEEVNEDEPSNPDSLAK